VLSKHPEWQAESEYVKEYFEKKVGYKPPIAYNQLIRKPRPDELPKRIRERIDSNSAPKRFYDEEF
jgi:hypothetical protein